MEIIAKTGKGFLIQATKDELKAILTATNGKSPDEVGIGQKIQAIDYASTIQKLKTLQSDYDFKQLIKATADFYETTQKLANIVENAGQIE